MAGLVPRQPCLESVAPSEPNLSLAWERQARQTSLPRELVSTTGSWLKAQKEGHRGSASVCGSDTSCSDHPQGHCATSGSELKRVGMGCLHTNPKGKMRAGGASVSEYDLRTLTIPLCLGERDRSLNRGYRAGKDQSHTGVILQEKRVYQSKLGCWSTRSSWTLAGGWESSLLTLTSPYPSH